MEYPPQDALEVAKLASKDIRDLQDILLWIAIPLALIPPVPRSWRWIALRTFVITVAVWFISMHYNIVFGVPWRSMVLDMQDPNSSYDGVGSNVGLLFLGWVPPFFECLGTLIVCRYLFPLLAFLWRRVTGKDHRGQAAPP
jgi:hypothetical protein